MKLMIRLAILISLLPVAALAQDVDVEWDRGIDFSQVHTYTWAKEFYPINDPVPNLRMAIAVAEELQAKGLRIVPPGRETYDVFVTYNAQIVQDPKDSSRKLVVIRARIFDSKNNNQIWRAGGTIALENDQAENLRSARRIVAAMFQKYPPPKKD